MLGGGEATGCTLPSVGALGTSRARSALAAMRDDTFAPRRIGSLPRHNKILQACIYRALISGEQVKSGWLLRARYNAGSRPDCFDALGIGQLRQLSTQPLQQRSNLRSLLTAPECIRQQDVSLMASQHSVRGRIEGQVGEQSLGRGSSVRSGPRRVT